MKYSKERLVKSVKYAGVSDILSVILKDDEFYSFEEVEELLKKFAGETPAKVSNKKKGKVN